VTALFKEKEKENKGALGRREYEKLSLSCVPSFLMTALANDQS